MIKLSKKKTENLYKAILMVKTMVEAKRFFRDLLTEQEIAEFGNRWQAAQMLNRGSIYPKIQQATGLSTRTIARISKWLNKGANGYKLVLAKMNHHNPSYNFKKG